MAEDYGGSRKKNPSRFMEELGLKILPKQVSGTFASSPARAPERSENNLELLRHALPTAFSFTQLKAFEKCPKQYKYAHLLKIPVPGHASLSFGQTIHNTLLNFFKQARERGMAGQADLFGKKPETDSGEPVVSWSELQELYKAAWIDQWYANVKQKQEYKQRGLQFLKNFYDGLPKPWPQPSDLEKGFTISIGGHKLRGKIDRIDPATGGIAIIDYKTSEKPPADPKDADLEQLHLYAIAAREALGKTPVSLSYIYLATEKPYIYPVDDKAIEKTRAKVEKTINEILESDFTATPAKHVCDHCDFRNICEDRWRG
jgi:DNA helicase-2/ATP-dependent DNA helicase PcrA